MNDNQNTHEPEGLFRALASDEGLQRAVAGVVVAAVVAGTKRLIFRV